VRGVPPLFIIGGTAQCDWFTENWGGRKKVMPMRRGERGGFRALCSKIGIDIP